MLVFDRAYADHDWWLSLTRQKVHFVTRLKDNAEYGVVEQRPIREGSDILRDEVILLVSQQEIGPEALLRRIEVWVEDKQETMVFVTNNLHVAASTIAEIYRERWQIEQIFQALIDRTRAQLNLKRLRTIFGFKKRPHRNRKGKKPPRLEVVVETPAYDLTIFKLHFGKLTLKVYTRGERVLRFEAIVHNTDELRCGRRLDRFPRIVVRLQQMLDGFLDNLYCLDACWVSDETLDQLPKPGRVGQTRVGGVDLHRPRSRALLTATLALACSPNGFTAGQFAAQVQPVLPDAEPAYDHRRASCDLKKLRGKQLLVKLGRSRRYQVPPSGVRTLAALVILREKVLSPILAGVGKPKMGRKPKNWTAIDERYELIRGDMFTLFTDLGIAA